MRFKELMLSLVLAIAFCGLFEPQVHAASPGDYLDYETFTSNSAASTITTDNRIIGYFCGDTSAGVCGLYDSSDSNLAEAEVFHEQPVAAGKGEAFMFPKPVKLTNGLYVHMSNATGITTVYYE